ncbi:MAG: cyclodeaminase/cyclohydrolase family protein [Actinomycetota bacterium]
MTGFDFTGDTVSCFLERIASDAPAPGGGAAAAVSAAMAAGLVAMAARRSTGHLDAAHELINEADHLRAEALRAAREDAEAYEEVLTTYRLPTSCADRPARLRSALEQAVRTPLAIAELGATVASLGSVVANDGNPNLHGDAVVAVILADASVKAAARLVEINVAVGRLEGHWLDEINGQLEATADAVRLVRPLRGAGVR